MIILVLRVLSFNPLSVHHLSIVLRYLIAMDLMVSFRSKPWISTARSSAKACMKSLSMFGFASSILSVRFHRRGERILPCGQPLEIFLVMERPWSCMVIVLSDSIVFIQSAIPLGIFASSIVLCGLSGI